MILHRITFGKIKPAAREEAEEVAEDYLRSLAHNGQAGWGYSFVVQDGLLCVYIDIAGVQAHKLKYHGTFGLERLAKAIEWFGQDPVWERLDEGGPKRDTTWKGAPFLFLFTHAFDHESPLCRGDTGRTIPLYRLPDEQMPKGDREPSAEDLYWGAERYREGIGFWQHSYRHHDSIWLSSGKLEIPTYKQLALPDSELSRYGRDSCDDIEETTGVPTFYYLNRYYGRPEGEAKRKCPGCGKRWRTKFPLDSEEQAWHEFPFKCDKCRLVSHMASDDDEPRHVHIGEWKPAKK